MERCLSAQNTSRLARSKWMHYDDDDKDDEDDEDDDDYDDDDDDDDVAERTRTGPSAARSDLEHQVNHNANISNAYHVFSSYEEGGPTGAGKTRCLAVYIYIYIYIYMCVCMCIHMYIKIYRPDI